MCAEPQRSSPKPGAAGTSPRDRLLALQDDLVETLIKPPHEARHVVLSDLLVGLDGARLTLLAEFVHSKRIAKIQATMPVTCRLLGDVHTWDRDFARQHPASDARNIVNALQFYGFLLRWWRRPPPDTQPLLPQVAFCEIAVAMLSHRATRSTVALLPGQDLLRPADAVFARRDPGVRLRVVPAKVRTLLMPETSNASGPAWVHLTVTRSRRTGKAGILTLQPEAFDLVRSLDGWQRLGAVADLDGALDSLRLLEGHGILELRAGSP